jgi:hypothetical protein
VIARSVAPDGSDEYVVIGMSVLVIKEISKVSIELGWSVATVEVVSGSKDPAPLLLVSSELEDDPVMARLLEVG